jgi:hypothetical protein
MDELIEEFKKNPHAVLKWIGNHSTDHEMRTEKREDGRGDAKKVKRRDTHE